MIFRIFLPPAIVVVVGCGELDAIAFLTAAVVTYFVGYDKNNPVVNE